MRPLKLVLSGWGPYKDTQTIDFTPVQSGGLFLIAGPTGAGKTTIFDGITFALFGEVSGSVREKDSIRSDFAPPETATGVEFFFHHQGVQYRIVRNPRYDRAKLRGEGMTTESENGELYRQENLIAVGSQQVSEAVTGILGMNYRQFKQISMIAQGEFQQLLTATSKDRTLIFRDIFQTKLYDTITQILGQRVKLLNGRLEENRHRMEEVTGAFLLDSEEWKKLCGQKSRNYPKLAACIRQDMEERQQEVEELDKIREQLEREYKGSVQQTEQARQNNRLIDQYRSDCTRLDQKKQELETIREQRRQLEKEAKKLPTMHADLEKEQEKLRVLEEQCRRAEDWKREREHLSCCQQKYLELDGQARQKKWEYERQEDLYRKAAAGILAQDLIQGMPCPVCGATEHPQLAQMTGEIPDEQKLEKLKAESEEWQERSARAQAEAASALGALGQMEQNLGEWKEQLREDADAVSAALKDRTTEAKKLLENHRSAVSALEKNLRETQVSEEKVKAACRQFKENLRKPGNLEKQDLAAFNRMVQELETKIKARSREREKLQTRLSVSRSGLKQLEAHMAERQKLEQEYGVLRKVERAASGSNNRKLVLEQYVLSVYFEDILRAANLRLRAMTAERYELYRVEESRDKRMKEGMELEVLDQYTGKRRSVKTLSGGESFNAALALALGTSDVVQGYAGGIQVETLFVDEGFGALDSESLNQAVEILSALSGGRRMIGIISHVEELKEQIENQILVEKTNNGSSIHTNFAV